MHGVKKKNFGFCITALLDVVQGCCSFFFFSLSLSLPQSNIGNDVLRWRTLTAESCSVVPGAKIIDTTGKAHCSQTPFTVLSTLQPNVAPFWPR